MRMYDEHEKPDATIKSSKKELAFYVKKNQKI
jgi:hypothetical protein